MGTDEALVAGRQGRPLHRDASDRVGAVEHDRADAERRGHLEAILHRGLERIVAAADVDEVDHEHVDAGKLRGRGTQARGGAVVEAHDPRGVAPRLAAGDALEILGLTMKPVLGSEHRLQADSRQPRHHVHRRPQAAVDRGGMGDQPHATPLQSGQAPCQHVESRLHHR